MTSRRWKEFGKAFSYEMSNTEDPDMEAAPFELPTRTEDDILRSAWNWGRSRMLTVQQTADQYPDLRLRRSLFGTFVDRLEDFKKQCGVLEFSDFLYQVLEHHLVPPTKLLIVDEAQDLSPIQVAVVNMWKEENDRTFLGGDPDQAIYNFQGADSRFLVEAAQQYPTEILGQSYRVPVAAHALAQKIIKMNKLRVDAKYLPKDDQGEAWSEYFHEAMNAIDENVDTFLLARNRMFFAEMAEAMKDRGVPFVVEGGGARSPYSSDNTIRSARTILAVRKGNDITTSALHGLIKKIPSRGNPLLPHGIKAKVERMEDMDVSQDFMVNDLGLGDFVDAVHTRRFHILEHLEKDDIRYLEGIAEKHGSIPSPKIRIMTIHGSKGREATRVLVRPDMAGASFREYYESQDGYESENRLAYVAVTRTKRDLCIAHPTGRKSYEYPVG
jgi:DNA helicase-2/ATP-dependent DNA helicase PcrA